MNFIPIIKVAVIFSLIVPIASVADAINLIKNSKNNTNTQSNKTKNLQTEGKVFKHGANKYIVVSNAYLVTDKNVDKERKKLKKSEQNYTPYSRHYITYNKNKLTQTRSLDKKIIVKKGGLSVILLDKEEQSNNMPAVQHKLILLNKTTNEIAYLSNSIIIGLKYKADAQDIAKKYGIKLVKLLGGKMAMGIYSAPINTLLQIVENIKIDSRVRFVQADIVENPIVTY